MDAVNNTKRICWWDNIKFVMIVLVVAGHFCGHTGGTFGAYEEFFICSYMLFICRFSSL